MRISLKTITNSKHFLKLASILFGYSFWVMLAQMQVIKLDLKTPVSFYNLQDNLKVTGPENIDLKLSGKRTDLYNLDMSKLAVHVNLDHIKEAGKYNVKLLSKNIFLHNKIKLLNYDPKNLLLEVA